MRVRFLTALAAISVAVAAFASTSLATVVSYNEGTRQLNVTDSSGLDDYVLVSKRKTGYDALVYDSLNPDQLTLDSSASTICTDVEATYGSRAFDCDSSAILSINFDTADGQDYVEFVPSRDSASVDIPVFASLGNGTDYFVSTGSGSDVVSGGNGEDVLFSEEESEGSSSGDDFFDGGDGDDSLLTGSGKDVVTGGPGSDEVFAGGGDDTVRLKDGEEDYDSECGEGIADILFSDSQDIVSDCEIVNPEESIPTTTTTEAVVEANASTTSSESAVVEASASESSSGTTSSSDTTGASSATATKGNSSPNASFSKTRCKSKKKACKRAKGTRTLSGVATDDVGIKKVELSLVGKKGKRCYRFNSSARVIRSKTCASASKVWISASVLSTASKSDGSVSVNWRKKVKGLKRGVTYTVTVHAIDSTGQASAVDTFKFSGN